MEEVVKLRVCPCCGQETNRVHSTYGKEDVNFRIGTENIQTMMLRFKWVCTNTYCPQKTFVGEEESDLICRVESILTGLIRMCEDVM